MTEVGLSTISVQTTQLSVSQQATSATVLEKKIEFEKRFSSPLLGGVIQRHVQLRYTFCHT